jgi:hypothetical protein
MSAPRATSAPAGAWLWYTAAHSQGGALHFFPVGAERSLCGKATRDRTSHAGGDRCVRCAKGLRRTRVRLDGRRPRTFAKPLTRDERLQGAQLVVLQERPRTRGDCQDAPRPCPWIGCKYHLAADVGPTGSLILNAPGALEGDFTGLPESCSLDVADRGGVTLEEVGEAIGVSRERIRQLEQHALEQLQGAELGALPDIGGDS